MTETILKDSPPRESTLSSRFKSTRESTESLIQGLSDADQTAQSMPDASPSKWHLAHTSWFFEAFILAPYHPEYQPFDCNYGYLFNSYYNAVGERHQRHARGLLTRPALADVMRYRNHVDTAMHTLLFKNTNPTVEQLTVLGINHEQQHQELILTDLLHLFSLNPLKPSYRQIKTLPASTEIALTWEEIPAGRYSIGHSDSSFCFDNETPPHPYLLQPFLLANRTATNGDWIQFIEEGGYSNPLLWLADGWATLQQQQWQHPIYWQAADNGWQMMTLYGLQDLDPNAPVCHISFYEADAFARWAGARLPTEYEWEAAAQQHASRGQLAEHDLFTPLHQTNGDTTIQSMLGGVWEWTASAYAPYPGFQPAAGAVGEYNGKFMCNQLILRGGSCATPASHIRTTYRNFFYPHQRWQFSGLRLAKDC